MQPLPKGAWSPHSPVTEVCSPLMAHPANVRLAIFVDGQQLNFDTGSPFPMDSTLFSIIRDALADWLVLFCPLTDIDTLNSRLRFSRRLLDTIVDPPRTHAPSSTQGASSTSINSCDSIEETFRHEHGNFGVTAFRVACTGPYARTLKRQWERLDDHDRKAVVRFVATPTPSSKFLSFVKPETTVARNCPSMVRGGVKLVAPKPLGRSHHLSQPSPEFQDSNAARITSVDGNWGFDSFPQCKSIANLHCWSRSNPVL